MQHTPRPNEPSKGSIYGSLLKVGLPTSSQSSQQPESQSTYPPRTYNLSLGLFLSYRVDVELSFTMVHPPLTYPQLDIKLDEQNYRDWGGFVKMLFDGLNLLSCIEDSSSSPEMMTSD